MFFFVCSATFYFCPPCGLFRLVQLVFWHRKGCYLPNAVFMCWLAAKIKCMSFGYILCYFTVAVAPDLPVRKPL